MNIAQHEQACKTWVFMFNRESCPVMVSHSAQNGHVTCVHKVGCQQPAQFAAPVPPAATAAATTPEPLQGPLTHCMRHASACTLQTRSAIKQHQLWAYLLVQAMIQNARQQGGRQPLHCQPSHNHLLAKSHCNHPAG